MFLIHLRDRAGAIVLAALVSLAWVAPLTAQQSQPTPTDDNPLGFTGAEWDLIRTAELQSRVFRLLARKVSPAVVHIQTLPIKEEPFNAPPTPKPQTGPPQKPPAPNAPPGPQTGPGLGSGVIIDADDGLILTNNHVIAQADRHHRIEVALADGRRMQATVFATDPLTDLAVIEIRADNLVALAVGNSDQVKVGDTVIAVGNPFGYDQSFTRGMISALGRDNLRITSRYGYEDFIQTDAAINPGNSGGPLVNLRGEIIGLNTALATNPLMRGSVGVGFAIPAKILKRVLPALRHGEPIVRGYLGVEIQDLETKPDFAEDLGLEDRAGAIIKTVRPNTPAERAGLQSDDIILTLNDVFFEDANDLRWKIAMISPSHIIKLGIWRNGTLLSRRITIAEQPSAFAAAATGDDRTPDGDIAQFENFGFTVRNLTPALAKQYEWDENAAGVVVVQVVPDSEAANIGFVEGDLIKEVQGKRIDGTRMLTQILTKYPFSKGVRLVIAGKTGSRLIFHKAQPKVNRKDR